MFVFAAVKLSLKLSRINVFVHVHCTHTFDIQHVELYVGILSVCIQFLLNTIHALLTLCWHIHTQFPVLFFKSKHLPPNFAYFKIYKQSITNNKIWLYPIMVLVEEVKA